MMLERRTDPGPPEVQNFTCHFFVIRFLLLAGNDLIRAKPRALSSSSFVKSRGAFAPQSNNFNPNYIIARSVPNSEQVNHLVSETAICMLVSPWMVEDRN